MNCGTSVVSLSATTHNCTQKPSQYGLRRIYFARIFATVLVVLALSLTKPTIANAGNKLETFGDYAQIGAPVSAALLTILMGDYEGLAQLTASLAVGGAATHALKFATNKKRPNYRPGNRRDAFPSGHTVVVWQPAAFVRSRYGCYEFSFNCLKYTVPFTAVAAITAYSRIDADKHDFTDILGAVVLAEAINWLMVDNFDPSVRITPTFDNGFGLAFTKRF